MNLMSASASAQRAVRSLQRAVTTSVASGLAVSLVLCTGAAVAAPASGGNTLLVPEEYDQVQEAIDAARDGDTILIGPGTYEPIDLSGRSLTLIGVGEGERIISATGLPTTAALIDVGWDEKTGGGPAHGPIVIEGLTFAGGGGAEFLPGLFYGGGMFARGALDLTLVDCVFTGGAVNGFGGGLLVLGLEWLAVHGCQFVGNTAGIGGGGAALSVTAAAEFVDCLFEGNGAFNQAGGLDLNSGGTVTVHNCTFRDNTASQQISFGTAGGLLIGNLAFAEIVESQFEGNSAGFGFGGGIRAQPLAGQSPGALIRDCVFEENSAANGGGAVSITGSGVVVIETSELRSNSSELRGGGVHVAVSVTAPVSIIGCLFESNTAPVGGGLATETAALVTVADSSFVGHSGGPGAGVAVGSNANADFTDCEFFANQSTTVGGGAAVFENSVASFTRCSFSNNGAGGTGGGGVVVSTGASAHFDECDFIGNGAGRGAAAAILSSGTGTFTDCRFENNGATLAGGAIRIVEASATIVGSEFIANTTLLFIEGFGGAISASDAVSVAVEGSSFTGHQARTGGAIDIVATTATGSFGVVASQFTDNSATESGGAISIRSPGGNFIDGCDLVGNSAGFGGALMVQTSGVASVGASTIANNSGGLGGGAFVWPGGALSIESSAICDNTPTDILGDWTDLGDNTFDCPAPLLGDLNNDGVVDGADLGILLNAWGPCVDCPEDLDGNGIVDGADLGILLGAWTE